MLQCRELAHRKFGDAEGVATARRRAAARYNQAQATHEANIAARKCVHAWASGEGCCCSAS